MPRKFRRRGGLAKKAYYMAKKNRRQLKQREVKYVDEVTNTAAITHTTGVIEYLSGVAQGDTDQTRDGDHINAKALHIRYAIFGNAADSNQIVRVVIFRKNDDTNTAPTMHGTSTTDYLAAADSLSVKSRRHTQRHKTLYDELFIGNPDGTENWVRNIYIKLKDLPLHYNDTAATTGS